MQTTFDTWTDITPTIERQDGTRYQSGEGYTFLRTKSHPMTLVQIEHRWGGQPDVSSVTAPVGSRRVRYELPYRMTVEQAIAYMTQLLQRQPTDLATINDLVERAA